MQVGVSLYFMPVLFSFFRRAFTTMAEPYITGSASMAFVTVPNMEVAKKIAHGLVSQKLVACVNIIPGITSVYEWEGKIEEDSELLLMLKTMTSKVDAVSDFVRKNHPYSVAEVISAKIDNGNPPYLKWISDVTMAGQK
ncbi:protein CutA homolog isoform X2 [Pomacea canaliculata]|uniref:protein CutA homolog isoform X2 n=1 Tax=Pomacea canaliculata TaxID=400727 RepID=UPI000D7278A9|nr:protein CutA homolog isoform X2 [Pomacea canaliculata]